MNHEVQELIEKAVKIVSKKDKGPGSRYPKTLKKIVISLRLDHNMSVRDIMKYVGISSYSAREWAKAAQKKQQFNKVSVLDKPKVNLEPKYNHKSYSQELKSINFNLKALIALTILLLFEEIVIHLIF